MIAIIRGVFSVLEYKLGLIPGMERSLLIISRLLLLHAIARAVPFGPILLTKHGLLF